MLLCPLQKLTGVIGATGGPCVPVVDVQLSFMPTTCTSVPCVISKSMLIQIQPTTFAITLNLLLISSL